MIFGKRTKRNDKQRIFIWWLKMCCVFHPHNCMASIMCPRISFNSFFIYLLIHVFICVFTYLLCVYISATSYKHYTSTLYNLYRKSWMTLLSIAYTCNVRFSLYDDVSLKIYCVSCVCGIFYTYTLGYNCYCGVRW